MNKKIFVLISIVIGIFLIGIYFFHHNRGFFSTHLSSSTQKSQNTPHQGSLNNETRHSAGGSARSDQAQPVATTQATQGNEANSPESQPTPASQQSSRPVCYTAIFNHAPIESHQDGEACLHHKNQISLNHELINPSSICVRVNGAPVTRKIVPGKKVSVLIGAVAGPHAELSIQYCTGKVSCNDPCKIAKDEFMSAIGGEDSEAAGGSWESADAGPSADEKALQGELKNLNQETKGDSEQLSLFKGWNQKSVTESCQGNQKTKR
jgi:hypothetical protein